MGCYLHTPQLGTHVAECTAVRGSSEFALQRACFSFARVARVHPARKGGIVRVNVQTKRRGDGHRPRRGRAVPRATKGRAKLAPGSPPGHIGPRKAMFIDDHPQMRLPCEAC